MSYACDSCRTSSRPCAYLSLAICNYVKAEEEWLCFVQNKLRVRGGGRGRGGRGEANSDINSHDGNCTQLTTDIIAEREQHSGDNS